MDVCCPIVCDMHVCGSGGTDDQGVDREDLVLVCNSDVEKGLSLSAKMKVFSPKMLMNALAAETALVLDELEAELIFFQQIQGVRNTKTDTW